MLSREKYNIVPFAGENFAAWSFRIKSILRDSAVGKAIEDEKFAEVEANAISEARAQVIIIGGVADSHLEYLKEQDTVFKMYKDLENNFKKKGVRSRLFLRRKLSDIRYNEKSSLLNHFVSMEEIFSQLKDADNELSEEEKINYVLMSMPKSYDGIVTALETVEDIKLDFVKDRLLGEEEKRKKPNVENQSNSCTFLCYACGKPGHKKFHCREKFKMLNNRSEDQPGTSGTQNYRRQDNQSNYRGRYSRGQGYSRGRGSNRGQGSGRGGGSQTFVAESEEKVVFMCDSEVVLETVESNIEWCIDSGCSDHLVNNKAYFSEYTELKNSRKISAVKNGIVLEAVGIGSIEVKCLVNKITSCIIKMSTLYQN